MLITTGNYNAAPVGNFSIYNSSTKDNYFAGNLGIGTTPSVVLDVTGSAVDVDQGVVGSLGGTLSSTTNDQAGYSIGADVTPGAASTQSYIGLGGYLRSSSSNVSGAELNGIAGVVQNTGTGTIGLAVGVVGRNALTSTGTISNSYALYAGNPINPFGTVGYNAGLYVEDITGGTGDNVGIEIAGADDYALYIGSGADNTDAANGITFGASADTNLYRGGSNLLQTDDALTIAGRLTIGAADTTGTLLVLDEKTNSGDPTGVAGAMYYNSNSGTFRCYTTSWGDCAGASSGDTVVNFAPEYAGGTLAADGSTNSGTMSTGYATGLSAADLRERTYYNWSTSQGTAQDYDIIITHELPTDFSSFVASSFRIWTYENSGTDSTITFDVYNATDNAQCITAVDVTPSEAAGNWEEVSAGAISGCSASAGDKLIITIRVGASTSTGDVRVGEFEYEYSQ